MARNLVKHPSFYSGFLYHDPSQSAAVNYRYDNAARRFDESWESRYNGEIVRKTHTRYRFRGYHLSQDLAPIQGYARSGEIDRIIKERAGAPYLLGIELEIEGASDREAIGDTLSRYLPDRHLCVRDGSLDSEGIEIVTSPLTPTEIGRVAWYRLLRDLSRAGARSHESGRCGLHISVSRSALPDRGWRAVRDLVVRHRALFEALSRRTIGAGADRADPFSYCRFVRTVEKYTAVNLSKAAVVEFRFFRGTLKPASFLASLEIVRSLVDYARSAGRSRLTGQKWWKYLQGRSDLSIGREYVAPHVDKLIIPREPRRATRDRVVERLLAGRRGAFHDLRQNAQGALTLSLSAGYLYDRAGIGYTGSLWGTVAVAPIDWDGSVGVPQWIRTAVAQGRAPSEIIIMGHLRLTNDEDRFNHAVRLHFRRGGWGRRGEVEVSIVRVNRE